MFYVMSKVSLESFGKIFRAKVLKMLKREEKIGDALINNFMNWEHSGISVHIGVRIVKDDDGGKKE